MQSSIDHGTRVLRPLVLQRLRTTAAFPACSGPRGLSPLRKLGDPRTFLQVPPGCARDTTTRRTAHTSHAPFSARRSPVSQARRCCRVGRPAWMSSWQVRQTIRVLRRRVAMRRTQSGGVARPRRWRSLRWQIWCTSTCSREPHNSQVSARSRWTNSVRRLLQIRDELSLRTTAVVLRASDMPPHWATSGGRSSPCGMVTRSPCRGPCSVWSVAR